MAELWSRVSLPSERKRKLFESHGRPLVYHSVAQFLAGRVKTRRHRLWDSCVAAPLSSCMLTTAMPMEWLCPQAILDDYRRLCTRPGSWLARCVHNREDSGAVLILSIFIGVAEPSQSSPPIEPVANQPAEGSKYATSDDFSHAEMAVASEGNASWACRKRVEF